MRKFITLIAIAVAASSLGGCWWGPWGPGGGHGGGGGGGATFAGQGASVAAGGGGGGSWADTAVCADAVWSYPDAGQPGSGGAGSGAAAAEPARAGFICVAFS